MAEKSRWAIVLGAGDGTRLAALTRRAGKPVPKQYCTLDGGASLFQLALARAERVVAADAVVTVVAARHGKWWRLDLERLPPRNVVVQPENRGTAAGVLLPLLEVARRDPQGRVVLLPSDHWVDAEWVLADAIGSAFELLEHDPRRTLLLGMSPEGPEPGYGWIVPGVARTAVGSVFAHTVDAFVEKPSLDGALGLMRRGALWNSFVIVATVPALLELYARRLPDLPGLLASCARPKPARYLADAYASLDTNDFCRDLLEGAEPELGLVHVPPCGWTDLGTPLRVAACVRRGVVQTAAPAREKKAPERVNLAALLGAMP
jgi:mannose-1-phosphate guanylyltransferase